jgi:multiple sugar transport system substrate-binding protein
MMKKRYLLLLVLAISPILLSSCTIKLWAGAYYDKLNTDLQAGVAPDVGYVDPLLMSDYIVQGWLKPVPNDLDVGDFYPQMLAPFQRDGQLYGVPHDVQTVALVVNMDRLAEAGLEPPSNWDEFREAAAVLTDRDRGVYGIGLTTGFWNYLPFLFQAGGQILDDSGSRLVLDTPEAVEALAFYAGFNVEDGSAMVIDGEWPELGAYSGVPVAFAEETIAMFIGGPGMYGEALRLMQLDPATQGTVGVFELPAGPAGKATIAEIRGFGLFSQPEQAPSPSAVDFLQYATSQEGMSFWIGDRETPPDYLPARLSLREAWLEAHPDTAAFVAGIEYAQSYFPTVGSMGTISEFYEMVTEPFAAALSGELTPEEALATINEEGNAILAREQ